jgi:hypothetical protein
LLVPFPILAEKPGNFVAQFKLTVMITKGKTTALTGLPIDEAQFKTENEIKDQAILDLLAVTFISILVVHGQVRPKEGKEETTRSQSMICISIFNHHFIINCESGLNIEMRFRPNLNAVADGRVESWDDNWLI